MGVIFNGNVVINGNVEMYDNGSVKINGNQLNVNINKLSEFIEENFKYSSNKLDYLRVAEEALQNPNDSNIIKNALLKLGEMAKELGKNIVINGLSQLAIDAMKGLFK